MCVAIIPSVCKAPSEAAAHIVGAGKSSSANNKASPEVVALVATVSATPSSPVPPPFARAPLEDRRKYEKLFCCDDDDSDDDDEEHPHHPQASFAESLSNDSAKQQLHHANSGIGTPGRLKLTDEDSIGSATDLKNRSDEENDERPKRK